MVDTFESTVFSTATDSLWADFKPALNMTNIFIGRLFNPTPEDIEVVQQKIDNRRDQKERRAA